MVLKMGITVAIIFVFFSILSSYFFFIFYYFNKNIHMCFLFVPRMFPQKIKKTVVKFLLKIRFCFLNCPLMSIQIQPTKEVIWSNSISLTI